MEKSGISRAEIHEFSKKAILLVLTSNLLQ